MGFIMNSNRDNSIDVAKGILIIMLVFHHIVNYGDRVLHLNNAVLEFMRYVQRPGALCFFMPAFFLITGMCSTFDCDFRTFLRKQIRQLLIPGFCFALAYRLYNGHGHGLTRWLWWYLHTGGPYWFLTALCGGKVIYYFSKRYIPSKTAIIGVLALLSFAGCCLHQLDLSVNYYWHWQMFDLTLFIAVGNIYKDGLRDNRVGIVALISYMCLVGIGVAFYGLLRLPYVTAGFGTNMYGWPLHIALSMTGAASVLFLSRKISDFRWLNYLGRNSLVVYMTQEETLILLMNAFAGTFTCCSLQTSITSVGLIAIATCAVAVVIAHAIDTTPLRIIMGKTWQVHGQRG